MGRFILSALLVGILAASACAAPSFLGLSGNIMTPNDLITPTGGWDVSYHNFVDIFGGDDQQIAALNYGVAPNLEIGGGFAFNGDSEFLINGKLRLLLEGDNSPAVTVGVFDLAGAADNIDGDPSLFVVATKTLSGLPDPGESPEAVGRLRANFGLGSGVYDSIFAEADYILAPRLVLMAEYLNRDLADGGDSGSSFNFGIRYAAADRLFLDAAVIDVEEFAFGAGYRLAF